MTSVDLYETVRALAYSMRGITFGDVMLISDRKPWYLPRRIRFAQIEPLDDIDKFNYNIAFRLKDYIKTDFVLLVHADGFVVHPSCWDERFLDYDYIGSPWPLPENDHAYRDADGNICRVGNSVSLRSRRLLEYPAAHDLPWERDADGFYNEDIFLCCTHKREMEAAGLNWAPFELALAFGREKPLPENAGRETFVFHKWWGENETQPRFRAPYKRIKDGIRPLLFWRRTAKWREAHGMSGEVE
ncbi:MAG: hypothetical protein K6G16_05565 [Lachnospiraceae bacterium]|nr:hypothetical protein [Lachnospiraceae bacterium]